MRESCGQPVCACLGDDGTREAKEALDEADDERPVEGEVAERGGDSGRVEPGVSVEGDEEEHHHQRARVADVQGPRRRHVHQDVATRHRHYEMKPTERHSKKRDGRAVTAALNRPKRGGRETKKKKKRQQHPTKTSQRLESAPDWTRDSLKEGKSHQSWSKNDEESI